ncbi:MAG TPA: response regulator [Candidatus Cloacimonadota bacterium]|nr:response regulator [Candidatus Cloacimonadota bacterium]
MKKPNILIVDDEKNVQLMIQRTLETEEYTIQLASSGKEALEKIVNIPFDVVILDFRLPDMNGLDVLRELGGSSRSTDMIMITAYGNIDVAVEAMKLGCVDFIQKPIDTADLRKVVNQLLERKNISYQQNLHFESLIEIAKLETKDRHYSKARELVLESLELNPDNSEAYNFLGVLYEIGEDLGKAISAYRTSLKLDPQNVNAKTNLERIIALKSGSGLIFS